MAITWPTSDANVGRPLAGVKVLDVSRVLAGPFSSMLLGDLGADVVKVEPPNGDETRRWGAPALDQTATYYFGANRNKWDLALDLRKEDDRAILRELIAQADVLLHNYTGAIAANLGVDHASVLKINPDIIYLTVSGFGPEEPERRGYDLLAQALAGIMSVTGEPDGPPNKVGVAISDLSTGIFSALAVVSALYNKAVRGKGAKLDVSLFDSTLALLTNQATGWLIAGKEGRRMGNDHPNVSPYGVYETADGPIVIAAATDAEFVDLCDVLGVQDLPIDARFVKNVDRLSNRDGLRTALEVALAKRSTQEWAQALEERGVPNARVQSVSEALSSPEAKSVREIVHPRYGATRQVLNPIRVDGEYLDVYLAPPSLDEHGQEIRGSSRPS